MLNLANRITISRMVLSFICIGALVRDTFGGTVVSLIVFILASFTDFLDGYVARKKNMISDLGKIMDPIADKVLIIGMFVVLVRVNIVSLWMVIVIIFREFLITGLRMYALSKGKVLSAQKFGKHKTFSQIVGIGLILILLLLEKRALIDLDFSRIVIAVVLWWVVIITTFSGIVYFWSNRKLIKTF